MGESYPVKTCDYCKTVGKAFTFMNGETICHRCLASVSTEPLKIRKEVFQLRTRNAELEAEVVRLKSLLRPNKYLCINPD